MQTQQAYEACVMCNIIIIMYIWKIKYTMSQYTNAKYIEFYEWRIFQFKHKL